MDRGNGFDRDCFLRCVFQVEEADLRRAADEVLDIQAVDGWCVALNYSSVSGTTTLVAAIVVTKLWPALACESKLSKGTRKILPRDALSRERR